MIVMIYKQAPVWPLPIANWMKSTLITLSHAALRAGWLVWHTGCLN
jgi:hypothetical protein